MIRIISLLLLAAIGADASAYESVDDPRRWAIVGLNIIDVRTGEISQDRAVVMQGGVIEDVVDSASLDDASVEILVDLSGQYAIPGLWDMHIHLRGGDALIGENERWLRQYLGFGVTAVRETGGDVPSSALHFKASVEQGLIQGPRIYSALRKLDGPGPRQSGSIPIASEQDIDDALGNLRFMGADFIKLYDRSFPPGLFAETIRKAEARNFRTAAHAPLYVPFRGLIDAGLDSVEHVFFFAKATNPNDASLSERMSQSEQLDSLAYLVEYGRIANVIDEGYARETFRMMARAGTAMTPTLAIEVGIDEYLAGDRTPSERERFIPAGIYRTHQAAVESLDQNRDAAIEAFGPLYHHAAALISMAADEGVMALAGSDTGAGNPFVYPGDSLHEEMRQLVAHGLSPLTALQAATVNPAQWMGLDVIFGSIEPGKAADIVVLSANPLADIANSRAISAVVQQGVYFDAGELESLKQTPRQ